MGTRIASRNGGNVGRRIALRYLLRVILAIGVVTPPAIAGAQGSSAALVPGDQLADRLRPAEALVRYEEAIAADSSLGAAYWKAATMLLELGDFEEDRALQAERFSRAALLARRGAELLPDDADARFTLGRALGRAALEAGARERIRIAGEIRNEAEAALAVDPQHGGALHLLGRWHAEVMRLGAARRTMARALLGGSEALRGASWREAVRLLEEAVALQPHLLTHRVALAEVYASVGRRLDAHAQLEAVRELPAVSFNDPHFKRRAELLLVRYR